GIEGDDVRVLQPGQSQVFLLIPGGQLEDHGTIAQPALAGQVDAAERAAAELREPREFAERHADRLPGRGDPGGADAAVAANAEDAARAARPKQTRGHGP